MATIREDYCSQELYRLLRKKGFDGEIHTTFDKDGYTQASITLQMAMKWLREVHHIHTEICLYKTSEDDIEPKKSRKAPYYTFGFWDTITGDNIDKRLTNDFIGATYEESCEAAIKYSLENLI